ncbi:MAG TPA: response regulator [Gaiellaceae bacterium]|nr:response regulator [Gaiellaceae bacterium]
MARATLRSEHPDPERRRKLELAGSSERRPRSQGQSPGTGSNGRVLVVDDEPAVRLLCRVNLQFTGFEVVEAANGAQGLELALSQDFDLILLDVMMPDIGGHDVLRRLSETSDVPVVFLSARTGPADLREGYALGAVDYITKPFDPIALGEKVREVMDRVARGEAEAYRQERLDELDERRP